MKIPKDLRAYWKAAREQGWEVTMSGGTHLRWRSPSGRVLMTGSSPSCNPKTYKHIRNDLIDMGLKL